MTLAIFDLDNTLLKGDSDHAWGDFLVAEGIVDAGEYERANDQFYQDYLNGDLDILRYLAFALAPLAKHEPEVLYALRQRFVDERIRPLMLDKAVQLLEKHRQQGHYLLIITATNRFVTQPIAELLGVDDLIATEPEMQDGRYTGQVAGTPSFQDGKVKRLETWLEENGQSADDAWFYSDSHNDVPLLEQVAHPIAVDPDSKLEALAQERGWPVISLRN
ncbi:HAD family hydrolase [Marinobacter nanhaiticus D15-8W]|uniref:Histidinol-phosphatase n=1 Tax=Marinobacter nanhaiticus D15-8W TaxID=626887 RepID=N6WM76_9GAMM|nr:HAD family hydrolase [Marinobacter nanhaiticus]ENO12591.1 HAD-IB family hydrolase [Marinobacter nanhaiticus D15-8W]BES69929.1 HAD family hydrolase [Marinobacter nanhaiticus D15-8W]